MSAILAGAVAGGQEAGKPAAVDFDRQIRPILADKCYACHGPDEEARESGLRLDLRDEALKPAESGASAIVPGKPDESPLIKKINNTKGRGMPPRKTNKTLSDAEKALLRDWIAQGAPYDTHWSFRAPARPSLPPVKDAAWCRNPIDRFLLARLEREGLTPSPEANRATLIRRLTLDLTGLPPTPAEVDAFEKDDAPDAYERLVDRLLARPEFGERMALEWLDAARFADTHGFHIDSGRDMTRWRAWVIDAFNADMPFDRFTVEQLAGDLLPEPTIAQKVASGFNRNHMINFEGGAVPEEYLNAYIVDRVNTTGTVWMGLAVGCAQCHDHKFDPITQKEYYGLYAFFNNVPERGLDGSKGNAEPVVKAPRPEEQARLDRIDAEIAELKRTLESPDPALDAAQAAWETTVAPPAWSAPTVVSAVSLGGATLDRQADGSYLARGRNPARETYVVVLEPGTRPVTGIRVEALPDESLKAKGPGRSENGNLVLTEARVDTASGPVKLKAATADFSQETFPASAAIDGNPATGWGIDPQYGRAHEVVFEPASPIALGEGERLSVTLEFSSQFASHQIGRLRVSLTDAKPPRASDAIPQAARAAVAVVPEKRDDAQRSALRSYYRTTATPEGKAVGERLVALRKERLELENRVPTAMVMQEMPTPRETFLLMRGQYDKRGDKVTATTPAFLPRLAEGAPVNRLGLARWLVEPSHPLTARVAVNRYWQMLFGTGLVKTSEDLGTQGERPSHPELLDWLATEFREPTAEGPGKHAWGIKRMVRLMVTSAAYRQSSAVTPDRLARDPENRLLSRGPRFRLPAEFIRDQALAASGLLKPLIGGRSVSPYQPPGLWEELMSRADGANWSAQTYKQDHGDDLYRRTMYTFWKRTSPPPSLATFDAPDRETCTVRRGRTNTPLQALVLMNDPTYVEASRKLAERMLKEAGPSADDRIAFAFRLATARRPKPEEVAALKGLFEEELANFRKDGDAARKLLKVGESPRDEALDAAELAAWATVAGVILNLDETVTRG